MIQPIKSHRLLQNGKYFSILKLIILQQEIASVWIFGDQFSWNQQGHEMNIILQHLVGTLPKYIYDLNTTKTECPDYEQIKILNIIFVTRSIYTKDLNCTCPTDYTIVMVPNKRTHIRLPSKGANILRRIAFGTIHSSDIYNLNHVHGRPSLLANSRAMHNLFVQKPLALNSSAVVRIALQLRPPITMMYFLNNTYGFYGPDALLAHDISKMLNMKLIVQSNVGIEYPRYASWFNTSDKKFLKSQKILTIRNRIIPPLATYEFYRNCSNDVDLCIFSQPIRTNENKITNFLYPHYKECLRIVVPLIKTEQQFAEKLASHSIVQAICLAIISMFISKIILNGSCRVRSWSHTFNLILAELFGQKRQKTLPKFWEKVWNVQLFLIAIFSTAVLSAISYQTLVSVKYVKQIDTLDDLIKSNLKIFVEKFRSRDFEIWGKNLDPKLRSKFVYQKELINLIRTTNNVAFVWDEGMAWLHITVSESMAPNGGLAEMRLATEPLYCGFPSRRVLSGSRLKHSMNTLTARLFESGIRLAWSEWTLQYLREYHRRTFDGEHDSNLQPLTLYRIYGILVLLIGGVLIGSTVFALEIFWKRFTALQNGDSFRRRRVNEKQKRRLKRKVQVKEK